MGATMNTNGSFFDGLKIVSVLLWLLWPRVTLAGLEIDYQEEQYSRHAHKLMDDHGVNALYKIALYNVLDFLPEKQPIKQRLVRVIQRRLVPGRAWVTINRNRLMRPKLIFKNARPKDLFGSFREEVPLTYVISRNKLYLTESTGFPKKEKYTDRYSKHYLLSGLMRQVHFSGEIHVFKNPAQNEVFLVFDNASGTYQPPPSLLPNLKKLLDYNFYDGHEGLYFITKQFDQKIDKEKLFRHDPKPFMQIAFHE